LTDCQYKNGYDNRANYYRNSILFTACVPGYDVDNVIFHFVNGFYYQNRKPFERCGSVLTRTLTGLNGLIIHQNL
jgi:hypothetical protein